jgi:hypothetical protein
MKQIYENGDVLTAESGREITITRSSIDRYFYKENGRRSWMSKSYFKKQNFKHKLKNS